MSIIVNLIGKRFGKLLVTKKLASDRSKSILWECICDCGNICEYTTRHLNRAKNSVKSCGCSQNRKGPEHVQWNGVGLISGAWWCTHVKHSANSTHRQHVELSIDIAYAWELFLAQKGKCSLTGIDLVIDNHCSRNTASLDRIDNNLGYIKGNVRWLHKRVNMLKRTSTDEELLLWCKLLVDFHENNANGVCPVK